MRKSIVLSVVAALLLLAGTPSISSSAQHAATDQTPTFYRLVPGTYVNGWPRFTVTYPKDWVERRPDPLEVFRVSAPGPVPYPAFAVAYASLSTPDPGPLDKFAEFLVKLNKRRAKEVTILSDRPSQLRDGTPAREIEFQMDLNGEPFYTMPLVTENGNVLINTIAQSN